MEPQFGINEEVIVVASEPEHTFMLGEQTIDSIHDNSGYFLDGCEECGSNITYIMFGYAGVHISGCCIRKKLDGSGHTDVESIKQIFNVPVCNVKGG